MNDITAEENLQKEKLSNECIDKKTESIEAILSPTEENRLHIMKKVQEMLRSGFSYTDIARETGISTRTVARYRT
jgi:uncharacterized protein YerC